MYQVKSGVISFGEVGVGPKFWFWNFLNPMKFCKIGRKFRVAKSNQPY